MNTNEQHVLALVDRLLAKDNRADMEQALRELLTPHEFSEVTKRLQIFSMLEQGITQRKIADTLGVGIATVTRGSHAFKSR